jgi:hypothetical protein
MHLPTFGFIVHINFIVGPHSLYKFEKKLIGTDKNLASSYKYSTIGLEIGITFIFMD